MKRLKNYRISENYNIEMSVNAYSKDEAQKKFDKYMSDLELVACNDADISFYVEDESLSIEESEID